MISLVGVLSPMENCGLNIGMLNDEVCIHIVTDVLHVLVTEASHSQLARITTACLTRNGVVSVTRIP